MALKERIHPTLNKNKLEEPRALSFIQILLITELLHAPKRYKLDF